MPTKARQHRHVFNAGLRRHKVAHPSLGPPRRNRINAASDGDHLSERPMGPQTEYRPPTQSSKQRPDSARSRIGRFVLRRAERCKTCPRGRRHFPSSMRARLRALGHCLIVVKVLEATNHPAWVFALSPRSRIRNMCPVVVRLQKWQRGPS